jgi:hypothetical protein
VNVSLVIDNINPFPALVRISLGDELLKSHRKTADDGRSTEQNVCAGGETVVRFVRSALGGQKA